MQDQEKVETLFIHMGLNDATTLRKWVKYVASSPQSPYNVTTNLAATTIMSISTTTTPVAATPAENAMATTAKAQSMSPKP